MTVNLILVMNRTHARLFEQTRRNESMRVVKEWDNPEGRMKAGELLTDSAGKDMNPRVEFGGNPQTGPHSVKEEFLRRFCSEVIGYIDHGRTGEQFDNLTLVAEPGTLGVIRRALGAQLESMVTTSISKDLCQFNDREVAQYLGSVKSY